VVGSRQITATPVLTPLSPLKSIIATYQVALANAVNVYSVAPFINVLVAELSNLTRASIAEVALIEIYSKLPVPPSNPLANIVPVPAPPSHPEVTVSVTGAAVVVVVVVDVDVLVVDVVLVVLVVVLVVLVVVLVVLVVLVLVLVLVVVVVTPGQREQAPTVVAVLVALNVASITCPPLDI